jgi:FkbM family methyltransferase
MAAADPGGSRRRAATALSAALVLLLLARARLGAPPPPPLAAARAEQRAFCADVAARFGAPAPAAVAVRWAAGAGAGLALEPAPAPAAAATSAAAAAAGLAAGVRLRRLDGIGPAAPGLPPYTLYAVDNPVAASDETLDVVSAHLALSRAWEGGEVARLVARLAAHAELLDLPRAQVWFVDIGANLGTHALAALSAGFSVLAFEAMAVNQAALRLSVCAAPAAMQARFALVPRALGAEPGRCGVFTAPTNVLNGNVRCAGVEPTPRFVRRQDVEVARLDDVFASGWAPALRGRVGALKIDVEGFEPRVLAGGAAFFAAARPRFIQAEVSAMQAAATGVPAVDFMRSLIAMGYRLELDPDGEGGGAAADPAGVDVPGIEAPLTVFFEAVD